MPEMRKMSRQEGKKRISGRTAMRLLHYSPNHGLRPQGRSQHTVLTATANWKPHGLWLSVEGENDWREWCLAEKFQLDKLRYVHEVTLDPDANICMIESAKALRAFHYQYCINADPRLYGINWQNVATDYQGIIIAPYQYGCRFDDEMLWYYGWDCASGCIWNEVAIASTRLLDEPGATDEEIGQSRPLPEIRLVSGGSK